MSKLLAPLKQYHFDRDDFCDVFYEYFTTEQIIDLDVACGECRYLDDFILSRAGDEFYIIHRDSGIMINWYKHLGRTNTCNRPDFTLDDLREFVKKLKEDLVWCRIIDDPGTLKRLFNEMANAD